MIDISKLTKADLGRSVVYHRLLNYEGPETCVITSWNETHVFVRYGNDQNSKATYPRDLEFEHQLEKK